MKWLSRFLLLFVGVVRWPLRAWLRIRVTPSDLGELTIDPDKPVCYILPAGGLSDWLALESGCLANGLPRPQLSHNRLPSNTRAVVLSLPHGRAGSSSELQRLIARGIHDKHYDAQIIPVSVFWGRNPIKETSLLRILFADSERPGRLRKFLIILAQGRNVLLHYGQPLDYRAFVDSIDVAPAVSVRKLARVLRVHFRRQRTATLGPGVSHRSQVLNSLLSRPEVHAAIEHTAKAEGIPEVAVRTRAREYADEIAADYSNIAIGFLLRVLTWLWNRIYDGIDVRHLQRLRATAHDGSVIYLPSHRSHMDYLLVSYTLYLEGFALPQIAAGINLNFWPVGGLLRRCGAFYLRRSFGGNQLYTAVFRAYVDVLIGRGQPMKFYPEGGRSRTGRLLPPKTGMLAMVAQSFLNHSEKTVSVVPVYIGYDRVMEVNSYFDELRGSRGKKNESMSDLVRGGRKVLKRKYGRAYISFGEPIQLAEFAEAHGYPWRAQRDGAQAGSRPDWLGEFVDELSAEVMCRINSAATLNASGLLALILLASPQKAVVEDEMIHSLEIMAKLARLCPYSENTSMPEATDGRTLLAEAEPLTRLLRVPHAWGDVLTVESREAVLLTYSRNNVMHLFALPSLIANFFAHFEQRQQAGMLDDALQLYPLIQSELSLRWDRAEACTELKKALAAILECGLLIADDDGVLHRPKAGSHEFAALMSLARIMREALERYGMTTVLLANNLDTGQVDRSAFERQCQLMAERMAIVTGRNSPEFFDLRLFHNHLQTLTRIGLLKSHGDQLEIEPHLQALAEDALQLLGPDIRQSILHLTSAPRALEDASEK